MAVMTSRTHFTLKCICGHTGKIWMHETASGPSQSGSYTVENLKGNGSLYIKGFANLDDVINRLHPVCPMCDSALTKKNLS